MGVPQEGIRFWHFADLHLGEHKGCSEGRPCRQCITEKVLARLTKELLRTPRPPHLLLFAGDTFSLDAPSIAAIKKAAKPLQALLKAARTREARPVGVTGDPQHDPPAWQMRRALRWGWLLGDGKTRRLNGVWVTGAPGSESGGTERRPRRQPAILLTHCESPPAGAGDFTYCALGHHHQYLRKGNAGRPGSPVSRWDGPGKAWPTYFIKGTLRPSGRVSIRAVSLETATYGAPSTRQFFTEHVYRGERSGVLVLVHAPAAVQADWIREPAQPGDPRLAAFRYRSLRQMRDTVARVAGSCRDDVFVTPSPGNSARRKRIVCYGRQLLDDPRLLKAFLADVPKKDAGTQTSDRAGNNAWPHPEKMVTLDNLRRWEGGREWKRM